MIIDKTLLSYPLKKNAPTGLDLRHETSSASLFHLAKDARSRARAQERASFGVESPTLIPEWKEVRSLAIQILEEHSRDIEVLSWLIESLLRIEGFKGLSAALDVTCANLEAFWSGMYSTSYHGNYEKAAPLIGLNGEDSEGTLIQALRLAPLLPSSQFGSCCLWDYQRSRRADQMHLRSQFDKAVACLTPEELRSQLADVESSIYSWKRLGKLLNEHCEPSCPSLAAVDEVLQSVRVSVIELIKPYHSVTHTVDDAVSHIGSTRTQAETCELPVINRIQTRDEALYILAEVANYFCHYEPHSPIGLSLETIVNRSRMDFITLLSELIPDFETRRQVLTAAGIQPKNETSTE